MYKRSACRSYSNGIYQQNDGVPMELRLVPVLAGIFVLELQTSIDDTFCYVKISNVSDILIKWFSSKQNLSKNWKRVTSKHFWTFY